MSFGSDKAVNLELDLLVIEPVSQCHIDSVPVGDPGDKAHQCSKWLKLKDLVLLIVIGLANE